MNGKVRDLFPGGNTADGFYSYYRYILEQQEASSIICLKGGPGTGKSTLMKSIGKHFSEKGENVDRFWCSSDPSSLDGILIRDRKVAIVDGTSPHIIDPENPGAVDMILDLGAYWDTEKLRCKKRDILYSNNKIKRWFKTAYNNIRSASELRKTLTDIYKEAMVPGEMYRETDLLITQELSEIPVTLAEGKVKKYFASAITPEGIVNHLRAIAGDYSKIYCFAVPVGFNNSPMLERISENAVHRGFTVEKFYCPMRPSDGIEHITIPEMDIAFITVNQYHDIEIYGLEAELKILDMREFIDWNMIENYMSAIRFCEEESAVLISRAIDFIKEAKSEHDVLESYYVPNMNFQKIKDLEGEIIGKIERNVL